MIKNVTQYLDETAKKYPEKVAVKDETHEWTYSQLQRCSLQIAAALMDKTLQRNPVLIYLDKTVLSIAAFLGTAYSGNFYTPVDIHMPSARVQKIVNTLNPQCIVTDREHLPEIQPLCPNVPTICVEDILPTESSFDKVLQIRDQMIDTDILYVLFTSGSTGTPKGVIISHRSVIDYVEWVTETFGITKEEILGNQAPFYFDNSILDIYSTIKTGATLCIIPPKLFSYPVPLLEYLEENKITFIFWVPSALITIANLHALKSIQPASLRKVLFCGEVMPVKHLNVWRRFLPDVLYANLYGPTEITDACTYFVVSRELKDDEPLPIGIPCANEQILVLDEQDRLITQAGVTGELCVRGTCLALGYYNNPEATRKAFVQNPLQNQYPETLYRTGDLVRYNEYGELIFLSRKDFQIKHLGRRIELGEIETAVNALPYVGLCCSLYDEKRAKILLFLTEEIDRKLLLADLKKMLPEYMLPGRIIYLEQMPMNLNGKIDRVSLKENYI